MKRLLLVITFSIHFAANSQLKDTAYIHMIDSLIRSIQPKGIIYYSDKVHKDRAAEILKVLPRELNRIKKRGIVFTNSEKKYIYSNFRILFDSKQDDNLFSISKRLPSDSIVRFVEMTFRNTIDSLRKSPDATAAMRYYMHEKPWAFSFSHPIYLRKGEILLSYFMYYINSSGEDGVRVYKRENFKWTRVATLGGGAW